MNVQSLSTFGGSTHLHPRNRLAAIGCGPCSSHALFIYSPSLLSWAFERILWIGLVKGDRVGGGGEGWGGRGGESKQGDVGGAGCRCLLSLLPQERRHSSAILRLIIAFVGAADARDLRAVAVGSSIQDESIKGGGHRGDRLGNPAPCMVNESRGGQGDVAAGAKLVTGRPAGEGGVSVDGRKDDELWSVFD
jgi:hypothetical protein